MGTPRHASVWRDLRISPKEVVHVEFVVELYELLTATYPSAGMALVGLSLLLLVVWGVKASAY